MKKKVLAMCLAAVMGVCGMVPSGIISAKADEGEAEQIIMTYLTLGQNPADLQMVQDAINEISKEKINVEVEFKPVAISETFSNYSLWIGSGEQVDLMCIAFQGLNNYVNSGQLLPLDEYLASDGSYLTQLSEELPIYD